MAAPAITLSYGEVLVTETLSQFGLYAYDAEKIKFGYVEAVYSTSDKTSVGTYVVFNPQDSRDFIYGSTRYYIVKENSISGTEPFAP